MAQSNRPKMTLEEYQPKSPLSIDDYKPYIGEDRVKELLELAAPIKQKSWANINSTFEGGGVAEMLQSLIPLARGLGIDAHWWTISGNDEFFAVTKKFHNMLQGVECPITLGDLYKSYLDNINLNAKKTFINSDLVVVHDPQPAGLIMNAEIYGNILWRCHIDTSNPSQTVWKFLLPYINHCSGAIFTMPGFAGPGLHVPLYEIAPCIDPRAEKNKQYSEKEALNILAPLFKENDIDQNRPIVAAISRYDVHKNQATILNAFKKMKSIKKFDKKPYLIFLGNTASDDPEGGAMLEALKRQAGDDVDIKFWVNVENNNKVVGALMRIAKFFVHVSTKEGFGLVVSEAMWQGTPVIGSKIGGIVKQVIDQKTGFLIENPNDIEVLKDKMIYLLDHPADANKLGESAREHVRENFLIPELMRKYILLIRYYTGIDQEVPRFRINDTSYSENRHRTTRLHPDNPESESAMRVA